MAALAIACVCLALAGVNAIEARHMSTTHGFPMPWSAILLTTTPRWIALTLVLPFVLVLSMRVPLAPPWASVVFLHVALLLSTSFLAAVLDTWGMGVVMPTVRVMFTMTQRLTRAWYDVLPNTVTTYVAVLLAAWGMTESRERARRTLGALQLEAQLQTARLAALRAQLQPHFLYNTLNGIAALVADSQPSRAVTAIEQLGELLHASLRDDRREEITIAEEVTLAERYLGLQRMRFGERLRYEMRVDPDVADCLVPVLLLQPLVENAVIHSLDAGQERLTVRVKAVSRGANLEISVENNGAVFIAEGLRAGTRGVGLSATRARLHALHGDRASLVLEPRTNTDGGVLVRLTLPRRTAPPPPSRADRNRALEVAT